MGGLFSTRRQSTAERLEQLERDITECEHARQYSEQRHRRIVGSVAACIVVAYVVCIVGGYLYYFPSSLHEAAVAAVPLIVVLPVVWLLRACISWCLQRQVDWSDDRLRQLRDERKQLLDNVKETETYKVASEILAKYDPAVRFERQQRERKQREEEDRQQRQREIRQMREAEGLRQRRQRSAERASAAVTPVQTRQAQQQPLSASQHSLHTTSTQSPLPFNPSLVSTPKLHYQPQTVQGLPPPVLVTPKLVPKPVPSRDRSVMDKFVDYLLGESVASEYALVCRQCHSHNGLAMKDEYAYMAFRCCYCGAFNPARKQRPTSEQVMASSSGPTRTTSMPDTSASPTTPAPGPGPVRPVDNNSPPPVAQPQHPASEPEEVEPENPTESDGQKELELDDLALPEDDEEEQQLHDETLGDDHTVPEKEDASQS